MKAMSASRTVYEDSKLDDTEFALAISPCPRIEESNDLGANPELMLGHSPHVARRQVQRAHETALDEDELTETLTVGWAIALAIAVAVVICVSGG